jgi:phosphoglycolate phosphatase
LRELGISASETVYVGDSLMKDVAMAQDADVVDVLAQYGAVKDRNAYRLLQQVSHWTEDDVRRESQINDRRNIAPSYTLHNRFDEIFNFFRFGDQRDRR